MRRALSLSLLSAAALSGAAPSSGSAGAAAASTSASPDDAPTPPLWGPVWTAPFWQTITLAGIFQFNNSVQWFYDSTTQPVGSSLYLHGRGQVDELCTSIRGHEFDDSPCALLATADGWRRVIFPEYRSCCKYCNTSDFCGIVAPDWLRRGGASYLGNATFGSRTCAGWQKQGGESNHWWAEVGTDLPCEYWETYPMLPSTNYWRFEDPEAINRDPIPSEVFKIPEGCDEMCSTTTVPYAERLTRRGEMAREAAAAAAAAAEAGGA